MNKYKGLERRKNDRIPLATYCPAKVLHDGVEFHCIMTNLSESGAEFTIEKCSPTFKIDEGDTFSCTVKTPFGDSRFDGQVAWVKITDEIFRWGSVFSQRSTDDNDPLNCFINSSF